jgi:putative ABC transport system ATP-binding protein
MTAAPSSLLELRQVSKLYQQGESRIEALKAVDLSILAGEFVAVWGPSGSGKSTFCNLIGLLDTPSAGSVHFQGADAQALSDDARSALRNRAIGFVFQSFNLIPVLSALENVMLPLQVGQMRARQAREVAARRLAEMGLEHHMGRRPDKLSGGQQQRVAIARALAGAPALVVADEPTANLDSENALKVIALMRAISHGEGTAFVFSTHDQRLLDRVDRQIVLHDGAVVDDRRAGAGLLEVMGTGL